MAEPAQIAPEPATESPPKRVLILGSTGSIGTSALKVARQLGPRMQVVGLAADSSWQSLVAQAIETGCSQVCLTQPDAAERARRELPGHVTVMEGQQGLNDLVQAVEADLVLIAIVGTAGLRPALTAIKQGLDLAVASKEILVMAGQTVMTAARRAGVHVLPVDSEHNAIFQCLEGRSSCDVRRLILTASGGPFRGWNSEQLQAVTLAQALRHPTWDMGRKITIDSATMFNKGLEMIESRWLFDVDMDRVDVVVHPQSIVHSMVEFRDHSVLAQLSTTDMCFPIQYAVTWPERMVSDLPPLDFPTLARLDFEAPDTSAFPALDLARQAGLAGGTLPAVLNAANEVAVDAFIHEKIPFPAIWETVAGVMQRHHPSDNPGLEEILAADSWARTQAGDLID